MCLWHAPAVLIISKGKLYSVQNRHPELTLCAVHTNPGIVPNEWTPKSQRLAKMNVKNKLYLTRGGGYFNCCARATLFWCHCLGESTRIPGWGIWLFKASWVNILLITICCFLYSSGEGLFLLHILSYWLSYWCLSAASYTLVGRGFFFYPRPYTEYRAIRV